MEYLFGIKNCKTVMVFFFSIKNFKSRKKVMEFFFSISNFESSKKVTESLFSGHASLCNFLEQYFLCQFQLNFFDYNNILIFMRKDAWHIPVNTVRATFLLHKEMVFHT